MAFLQVGSQTDSFASQTWCPTWFAGGSLADEIALERSPETLASCWPGLQWLFQNGPLVDGLVLEDLAAGRMLPGRAVELGRPAPKSGFEDPKPVVPKQQHACRTAHPLP